MVGEPTSSRAVLRRSIMEELEMPFFERFGTTSSMTGTPTVSSFQDSALIEEDGYWNGAWLYMVGGSAAGDVRQILAFTSDSDTIFPSRELSGIPAAGDTYEIHNIFNAFKIHGAINRAIKEAESAFWKTVTSEELIIQEDRLAYDLSGLATAPWFIREIEIERVTSLKGEADSSTNTTLVDAASDFSNVAVGWLISIYDGTGRGQLRTVLSVSGTEITVSAVWTTNPDTTSKFTVWDPNDQDIKWYQVFAASFDTSEYPSTLYLTQKYPALHGMRIRLKYLALPGELSADADTTVVPEGYLIPKIASILYGRKMADNRSDRQKNQALASQYWEMAEQYLKGHAWIVPSTTIWLEEDITGGIPTLDTANPLGWGE